MSGEEQWAENNTDRKRQIVINCEGLFRGKKETQNCYSVSGHSWTLKTLVSIETDRRGVHKSNIHGRTATDKRLINNYNSVA
jgi:hypothetical protein